MPESPYAALSEVLPDFTYKPGWQFELHDLGDGDAQVDVAFMAVDSHAGGDPQKTTAFFVAPHAVSSATRAKRWLRAIVLWVEEHEADEWLKVRGRPVHDPHQAGRDLHQWTYPNREKAAIDRG